MKRAYASGLTALGLVLAHLAVQPAMAKDLPDRFNLGRDAGGDPCVATRDWTRTEGVIKSEADQAFVMSCRGVSSARLQGVVMPKSTGEALAGARQCGEPGTLGISDIAIESARRCYDPKLGMTVVELRTGGARPLIGIAAPNAIGPLVALMRSRATGQAVAADAAAPSIDFAALPAAPTAEGASTAEANVSPETALQLGIQFMHNGQNAEASRMLNDALSRTDSGTSPATVVELMMTAALADSGLGQFEAAEAGFAGAALTLSANQGVERAAYLEDALRTYRALDAINRRQWSRALRVLDARRSDSFPLRDPVALSMLNRSGDRTGQTSLSLRDKAQHYWLILDIQQHYARSVALLALNRHDESLAALEGPNGATARFRNLETLAKSGINFLRSQIQLQHARIEARAGRWASALAGYDCTIQSMKGLPQPNSCLVPLRDLTLSGAEGGIAIAAIQLERASVAQKAPGSDPVAVQAQYGEAIETLVTSGRAAGGTQQPALIGYFQLLLEQDAAGSNEETRERFFRAMQVVGDPAIASDMARLANVVASDGTVGAKIRDKVELERRITQLRYQIAALSEAEAAQRATLEGQRRDAETELEKVTAALAGQSRYLAQDDSPVSIAEIRATLRPGEIYLKLVDLSNAMFGIAVNGERSWIYQTAAPVGDIAKLSNLVLESARSHIKPEGGITIRAYNVEGSYALLRAISGPAFDALASARGLVFDPSGPLRALPVGILVTDANSVQQYKANRKKDAFDYSNVAFLATKADLSMALSPRSFLLVRQKLVPSSAPNPFLGLGENAASPTVAGALASRPVLRGPSCAISYSDWARVKDANPPISSRELRLAAAALGAPDAPIITDQAFTDTGILKDSAEGKLSEYQVLHFATHGLPETSVEIDGCKAELQPSLVTTMAPPAEQEGAASNGLLTFSKVAELKLNANLVVLSACETSASASALSNRQAGAEGATGALDGLIRAFITANARSVLATYWRVPASEETEELMTIFYQTGRTSSIGEALRTAQAGLIRQKQWSHPYYWGAYFVVGDTAKTMLTAGRSAVIPAAGNGGL